MFYKRLDNCQTDV